MIIVVGGVEVEVPGPIVDYGGPAVETLDWTWSSWLGDTWELTSPGSPVTKVKGCTGFDMPDVDHIVDEYPLSNGATWQDARIPPRDQMLLPVWVHGADSAAMKAAHRAFIRSLNPWQLNTVTIASAGGERRSIDVRYVDGADSPNNIDPQAGCSLVYAIGLRADQPFFRGDPVMQTFRAPTSQPYFKNPPLRINRGHTFGAATISNPGDVDSPMLWEVDGPFTGFTVGVNGLNVVMSVSKSLGQSITIDTTPGRRRIVDDTGTKLLPESAVFADIPPGVDVPLTVDISGSGTGTQVTASLVPLYWSGW